MANRIAAILTTAVIAVAYWGLFHYGVLTRIESALVGAILALIYHVLRDGGRISDLEEKVGMK